MTLVDWSALLGAPIVVKLFRVVLIALGAVLAILATQRALRLTFLSVHHRQILKRLAAYATATVAAVWILRELGLNLGVLLGAAGVLTVAFGFAAQTVASNALSGFFLMGEQPFRIGDVIKIGETTGEVVSIDLLSVHLRTFDNLLVRIPNETVMKSAVTNNSRFPIRRIDLQLGVAYKESLEEVRAVLQDIARSLPHCLQEPEPLIILRGFGESSLDIQFSVWARRELFLDVRNQLYETIKVAFDREGIEIPFPHRTLYAGAATEPIPVRVVGAER